MRQRGMKKGDGGAQEKKKTKTDKNTDKNKETKVIG